MIPLPTNARPSLLRRLNERSILQSLQSRGPLSRAELTRLTGISGPTVTRAVLALLEAKLVEEEEVKQGLVGRPGKIVRLARSGVTLVGVVIGSRSGLRGRGTPARSVIQVASSSAGDEMPTSRRAEATSGRSKRRAIRGTSSSRGATEPTSSKAAPTSLALSAPVETVSTVVGFDAMKCFRNEARSAFSLTPAGCRRGVLTLGAAAAAIERKGTGQVAGAEGIEPPTFGFGDRRSAN